MHANSIHQQLQQLLQSINIDTSLSCYPEKDPILKCIAKALNMNIACLHSSIDTTNHDIKSKSRFQQQQQQPSHYRTVIGSQDVYIHPSSSLFLSYERSKNKQKSLPKYVIYAEILITTKHYMRFLSILDESWIDELNIPLKRNSTSTSTSAIDRSVTQKQQQTSVIKK